MDIANELVAGGLAVAIIVALTADLKPLLRGLLPAVFDSADPPWPLVARLIGVGAAFLIDGAGFAPGYVAEAGVFGVVLFGVILGHMAALARDGGASVPDVLGSILGRSQGKAARDPYVEPGP